MGVGDGGRLLVGVEGVVEAGEVGTLEAGDALGEEATLEAGDALGEEATLEASDAVGEEARLEAVDAVGEEATLEAGTALGVVAALGDGLSEGESSTLEGVVEGDDREELDPLDEGVLPTEDIVGVLLAEIDDCDFRFELSGEVEYGRGDEWGYKDGKVEWGVLWFRRFEKIGTEYR